MNPAELPSEWLKQLCRHWLSAANSYQPRGRIGDMSWELFFTKQIMRSLEGTLACKRFYQQMQEVQREELRRQFPTACEAEPGASLLSMVAEQEHRAYLDYQATVGDGECG